MLRPVHDATRNASGPQPCGRGSGFRILLACLAALGLCAVPLAAQQTLEPSGFVNDYAGVLSQPMKAKLEGLARELQQKTGAEVAVAIVLTLEGDTVESYANLLAERWGVGDEDDRGALLLLATEGRQLRLEVGYGLEPILPDGRAGQILDVMTPLLRQGDYDTAVALGVSETAQIVAADAGVELTGVPENAKRRGRPGSSVIPWVWLTIMLVLALLPRRRRRGAWADDAVTTSWWLGNVGGRGGRRGGWSSGGGFGGFGGGGFGGGGASRGW